MDGFGEEGHNGVSVVRLVELGLVQPVDEDDEVLLRADLSLCKTEIKDDFGKRQRLSRKGPIYSVSPDQQAS